MPTSFQKYRIDFDPAAWSAGISLYDQVDVTTNSEHVDRMYDCRRYAYFARHQETGQVRVATRTCKQRWCPLCNGARRSWLQHEIGDWIKPLNRPKFLTLTIKHSDAPLAHQIDTIYNCFQKLKKTAMFHRHVHGGIWFFQTKLNAAGVLWHPHIHVLMDSDYIPHGALSALWLSITGHSPVVDIRTVHSQANLVGYVARYATLPVALADTPSDRYLELHDTFHGRKLCGKWGTARIVRLRPPPFDDDGKWRSVGSWSTVAHNHPDSLPARAIVSAWLQNVPLPAEIDLSWMDKEIQQGIEDIFLERPRVYDHTFFDIPPPNKHRPALDHSSS